MVNEAIISNLDRKLNPIGIIFVFVWNETDADTRIRLVVNSNVPLGSKVTLCYGNIDRVYFTGDHYHLTRDAARCLWNELVDNGWKANIINLTSVGLDRKRYDDILVTQE